MTKKPKSKEEMRARIERKFRAKLIWNAKLFALAIFLAIAFIHHASLYSFPPDFDTIMAVPAQAYLFDTILAFVFMKLYHRLAEKSEIIGDGE